MQSGNAEWECRLGMQTWNADWECRLGMQTGEAKWECRLGMQGRMQPTRKAEWESKWECRWGCMWGCEGWNQYILNTGGASPSASVPGSMFGGMSLWGAYTIRVQRYSEGTYACRGGHCTCGVLEREKRGYSAHGGMPSTAAATPLTHNSGDKGVSGACFHSSYTCHTLFWYCIVVC